MFTFHYTIHMNEQSIPIKNVPKTLFHIVPKEIFLKYTNTQEVYDPRNREDFGKNSPYIHTTPSVEQMNSHLSYLEELPGEEFYLLEITISKLNPEKVTFVQYKDRIYHHVWSALPQGTYI